MVAAYFNGLPVASGAPANPEYRLATGAVR
jgi:hypothetical protein